MPSLVELATQIVAAQASSTAMSTEEILSSLTRIHGTMGQLEKGIALEVPKVAEAPMPAETTNIAVKEAFRKNEVVCMICGKAFQTLKLHLTRAHHISTADYRKQFAIPKEQYLTSKTFQERLKQSNPLERLSKKGKVLHELPPLPELPAQRRQRGRPKKVKNASDTGLGATEISKKTDGAGNVEHPIATA